MSGQADATLLSTAPPDIVLDVVPFQFSVPGAGTYSFSIDTDIDTMCMFEGRFLVDGASQYQDVGGSVLIAGVTFQVLIKTSPKKVSFLINNGHAAAHTVKGDIVLIARGEQGEVPTPKNIQNINFFDSQLNYSKIYKDVRQTLTITGGGTAVAPVITNGIVPHNIGIYPTTRVFLDDGTNMIDASANNSIALLFGPSIFSTVRVATSQIITEFSNQDTPAKDYFLTTRIYYDPS